MLTGAVVEVHGNVTFSDNTAGLEGGAVSLPFDLDSHLSIVVVCDILCEGCFDLQKQLAKLRRKG